MTYQQDPVGNTLTNIYASGLLQNIQDPAGRLVTFGYSGGLLQSIQDWANRLTTFKYNTASASPLNLLTTMIGPTGCQTQYQYSTFTQWNAGTYSSKWLLSGVVDPNGYGTSYSFDMQSRVINRVIQGVGTYTYLYAASSTRQRAFALACESRGSGRRTVHGPGVPHSGYNRLYGWPAER